jgi:hypothetical protein
MLRWLLSISLFIILSVAFYVSRPPPITSEAANELLAACLKDRLERCSIKDDSRWPALSRQQFRLTSVADPRVEIANYEFASLDGRYCAFVQFGKGDLSFVRTAEFYSCANRSRVTLGIG